MTLAVLLRNCPHNASATSTTLERYALQADSVTIQGQKAPLQIGVAKNIQLMDLGSTKPQITITGIVDNIGQDTSNTTAGFQNMTKYAITRKYWASTTNYTDVAADYYVPYKNVLEEIAFRWVANMATGTQVELEIGDANFPRHTLAAEPNTATPPSVTQSISSTSETGGAVYVCALANYKLSMMAATEDRWEYQLNFLTDYRKDILF